MIEREGGVVVKTMGDGLMAVFGSSAVRAVAASVALHELEQTNRLSARRGFVSVSRRVRPPRRKATGSVPPLSKRSVCVRGRSRGKRC